MPGIVRSGYTIIGWSTSPIATQAKYKVGQKVTVTKSTTFYAITSKKLVATFQKGSAASIGETTASCTIYNMGTLCSVMLPSITPSGGRSVRGWATTNNNPVNIFKPNTKIAISQNITFYAIMR